MEEISDALRRVKAIESTILLVTSMHTLGTTSWYGVVWSTNMVMLTLTEDSCSNCAVRVHCASWTLSSNTVMCTSTLMSQIFCGSTVTHWFLHSCSWLVLFSVGRSCQMGCWTVDNSPPGGLQLSSGKTARVYTNVQDQKILPNQVGGSWWTKI